MGYRLAARETGERINHCRNALICRVSSIGLYNFARAYSFS